MHLIRKPKALRVEILLMPHRVVNKKLKSIIIGKEDTIGIRNMYMNVGSLAEKKRVIHWKYRDDLTLNIRITSKKLSFTN